METALIYIAYTAYTIAALLMIGTILLQEGKGGGLSALGGTAAESAFGASNPIRRMTAVLAVVFFLTAAFLSIMSPRRGAGVGQKPETPSGTEETAPGEDATEEDATEEGATEEDAAAADAAPGEAEPEGPARAGPAPPPPAEAGGGAAEPPSTEGGDAPAGDAGASELAP